MLDKRPQRPKAVPRKVRIRNAGSAAGRVSAGARRTGVFAKPIASVAPKRPSKPAPKVSAKPKPRPKIAPTIKNPTPRQKRAVDRVARKNVQVLGVASDPAKVGTFPKGKQPVDPKKLERASRTGDARTREAVRQIAQMDKPAPSRAPSRDAADPSLPIRRALVSQSGPGQLTRKLRGVGVEPGEAALNALQVVAAPNNAIAGTVLHGSPAKGLRERTTWSDVVKAAPKVTVKLPGLGKVSTHDKGVAAALGLGLDVVTDPTTYVTFGASAGAKATAAAAGKAVEKKALKKGLSKEQADRFRARAEKQTADSLKKQGKQQNKGITVGLTARGKSVSTSGKASGVVLRKSGASAQATKLRESKAVQTGGQLLSAGFRPKGVTAAEHKAVRSADRKARAATQQGRRTAEHEAVGILKQLGPGDGQKVIDALEGQIKKRDLPEHLRPVAKRLEDRFKFAIRQEQRAGVTGHGRANYFPHKRRIDLDPDAPKPKGGQGGGEVGGNSSRRRTIDKPLAVLRKESPALFSEDVPLVYAQRMAGGAAKVAKAKKLQAILETGKRIKPSTKFEHVNYDNFDQGVYRLSRGGGKSKLERIPEDELEKVAGKGWQGGQYAILNRDVADRVIERESSRATQAAEDAGRFFDRKVQGRWKTLVTVPNPQYHFTNLYGDNWNAFLGDAKFKDVGASAKALKQLSRREKATRNLEPAPLPARHTVKVGDRNMPLDDLLDEANEQGVVGSGFAARDLPELLDQARETVKRTKRRRVGSKRKASRHPLRAVREASETRENLPKLMTYISARKRGMNADDAAEHALTHHFDYGDLTEFERKVLRRLIPFYTFTRKNVPLQAKTLVKRPGKFATLEKVRQEGAKASGQDQDWEKDLPDWLKRKQPIPIPLGKAPDLLQMNLPAQDLQRLSLNPEGQLQLLAGQLSPFAKVPYELIRQHNLYFNEPFRREGQGPRTAMPQWLAEAIGPEGRKTLGVEKIKNPDRKQGGKVWGWHRRLDYAAKLTPFSSTGLQLGTPGKNSAGRTPGKQLFGYGTGLRLTGQDRTSANLTRLSDKRDKLISRREDLGQQEKTETQQYRELRKEIRWTERRIKELSARRGDKDVIFDRSQPKKKKDNNPFKSSGGSSEPNPFKSSKSSSGDNPFK